MAYGFDNVTIEIIRGDTFETCFEVIGADLEGASVKMEVRTFSDKNLVLSFSTDAGSVSLDGQFVTLRKEAVDMQALQAGRYQYDVQFTLADNFVVTGFGGNFIVKSDVTI